MDPGPIEGGNVLNIAVEVDGIAVVKLAGELAYDEAEDLLANLEAAGTKRVGDSPSTYPR